MLRVAQMVVVAFPVGSEYPLDKGLVSLLNAESVQFVDGHHVAGITDQSFPDGYHMNQEAAAKFTSFLASNLTNREWSRRNSEPNRIKVE